MNTKIFYHLQSKQTVAQCLRGESFDEGAEAKVDAGHHEEPQALYLVDRRRWEEYETGHGEDVLGDADHEGEEVAECAHHVPLGSNSAALKRDRKCIC